MISCYRPDTIYPVYDKDVWTDPHSFDPTSFGRAYDFNRPFFEQYCELLQVVPRMARIAANIENSPYVNLAIGLNNCYLTFSCIESQDCMYGVRVYNGRDCIDTTYITHCELCYECVNAHRCYNLKWSIHCFDCRDTVTATNCQLMYMNMGVRKNSYNVQFCYTAMQLSDAQYTSYVIPEGNHLFGCTGFNQKASYCILNKQYTKEEYEELVPRIIAHMKSTGEYGQFFPMKFSDFPYVDSIAQEFFPISSISEAQKLDITWTEKKTYPITNNTLAIPDNIDDVTETICEQIIADKDTQRAFKYQKKEIAFYKAHHIPLPEYCFESRNLRRSRNLLQLAKV